MSLVSEEQRNIKYGRKCTAVLETEVELPDGSLKYGKATAFIVSEDSLLTAASNVTPECGKVTRISIRYTGKEKIEPTGGTMICQVVDVTPDCSKFESLAILKSSGVAYDTFLHLSTDPLPSAAIVHVIGYPGEVTKEWLEARLPDLEFSGQAPDEPRLTDTLTAVEAKISAIRDCFAIYDFSHIESKIGGMRGGCLFYNNKVYGIRPILGYSETEIYRSSSWAQPKYCHSLQRPTGTRVSRMQRSLGVGSDGRWSLHCYIGRVTVATHQLIFGVCYGIVRVDRWLKLINVYIFLRSPY